MVSPFSIGAMPNHRLKTRVFPALLFIVALVGGVSLVLTHSRSEARRADYLSHLPEWSSDTPETDAASATGYQAGQRVSVVPGHDKRSFAVIAIAQQMLAKAEFRIDRIDYENTPMGHPVHLASVYPWLLAASASVDQHFSGRPTGQCVEVAALQLNPNLLLFGLVTISLLAARVFGCLPAALLSIGMAATYPFAAAFVPGVPNPLSLHALCMLCSLLALLAGADPASRAAAGETSGQSPLRVSARICFAISGVFGALGLWLDVPSALPFIGGVAVSGLLLSLLSRAPSGQTLPWRAWGMAGAGFVLLGYFIDYFPARGEGIFRYIHPLYALAWIGVAEILVLAGNVRQQTKAWSGRSIALGATAVVALLLLPVLLAYAHTDLYTPDGPDAFRLDPVSNIAAPSVAGWLAQDGLSPVVAATLLPLLLVPFAVFILFRVDPARRLAPALALGPVIPCLLVGSTQLSFWSHLDVALLALIVALATTLCTLASWRLALVIAGVFVLSLVPGLYQEFKPNAANASLSPSEFESYIERDLAHWLRQHSTPRPAVLAPPRVTSGLCFYGGLAGLSTFDRDNQAGTSAAIRIVSATSFEEAFALIDKRKLTHIIVPFWDTYLDEYLRLGLGADAGSDRIDRSFLANLRRWQLPAWVRPVPYRLPPGPGVDGAVLIFEIVGEQPPAVAAARDVEYFLEMDQIEMAREKARELAQYPNDWGALAALCLVATATNDAPGLEGARGKLFSALDKPERRRLVWDRRVTLAIVLAQQKRPDLAKPQLEKCLAEIDADKLRSLTTVSLYRFDLLCKLYRTEITDPGLRTLSRTLLRPDLRSRL